MNESILTRAEALVRGYVACLAFWLVLSLTLGDRFWWLTLLNRIPFILFFPTFTILGLAIWRRQVLWLALVPASLFVWLYGPYLVPKVAISPQAPTVSVMSYNVLYSNRNSSAIANLILRHQPDLIALQEVRPRMMAQLQALLNKVYPWYQMGPEHPYGTTAIFSRFPLSETVVLDLETDRSAVVTRMVIEGRTVQFISAHLLAYNLLWTALPDMPRMIQQLTANQRRQVEILTEVVLPAEMVTILACDCNTQETSDSYRLLSTHLTNAVRARGWLWEDQAPRGTQPENRLQRLDYIFFRGPVTPQGVYLVNDSGGSDHQPLLAIFNVRQAP